MKKSMHTLLTAAAFAAAMGGTVASNADAASFQQKINIPVKAEYDPSLDSPQDVYGPPEWFGQNTTTAVTENIITNTTRTTVTVYGPPSVMSSLYAEQYGSTTSAEPDTATTTTEDFITTTLRLTTTTIMTVYGPPEVMSSLFNRTTETTAESFITTTTTQLPQLAYGPPYLYMPRGDMTLDFQLDALDLAKMKNMLISGEHDEWDDKLADTNDDGEFNIADVVTMQNYLLGRIDEFELPQPVYGAPLIYETK